MNIAESAAIFFGKVYTIGQLVHNFDAICTLESKNVCSVERVEDLPENSVAIIRSHGVGGKVYEKLADNNIRYRDATCPYVKKIHEIVAGKDGVVIIGDENHPEVQGIIGHAKESRVINLPEMVINVRQFAQIIVAQTTFNRSIWIECIKIAKKHCTNAQIFDTICNATVTRQDEAGKLSQIADVMLVIGDKSSSNSVKLYEICAERCKNTYFIENVRALPELALKNPCTVGITAGASVPAGIIKEVHNIMNEELRTVSENGEFDFMAEVDKTMPEKIYAGRRVKALVVAVNKNEIVVDMGTKHSGYIPLDEIGGDPGATPESIVKVGDEIECIVMKVNDAEGFVYLSKKQVDSQMGYQKLVAAYETGEVLDGYVASVVNSGVIVTYEGTRIFVPASQSGVPKTGQLESLLKKPVKFKIIEVNEQRKRMVGSIKVASRFENDAAREKFWSEIEVGKAYTGEIKSMESYGVFVDLGGVDGMVHLSELTWSRIKHPKEIVAVGDKLEVTVKAYDPERKRVSLSAKNPDENPWAKFANEYSAGSSATVKIVSITPFGAFAQIVPGIDGLIHISQISKERIKNVNEVLQVGQEVDVVITDIDVDRQRVSISARALLEPDDAGQDTESPLPDAELPSPDDSDAPNDLDEPNDAPEISVEETPETEAAEEVTEIIEE
jgi:4-hydroxy-3-methylbut-2-enyl diphosphate reductase